MRDDVDDLGENLQNTPPEAEPEMISADAADNCWPHNEKIGNRRGIMPPDFASRSQKADDIHDYNFDARK